MNPTPPQTPEQIWNARYQNADFPFGTAPNDFLVSAAHYLPEGGRVLCLGDGDGRNGVWLAERGFVVTSVDLSAVALQKAEQLAQSRNVPIHTLVGDLETVPLPACDAVVSIFCHLPPLVRQAAYRRAQSALANGGVAIIEAYHPAQIGRGTGGPDTSALLVRLSDLTSDWNDCALMEGREILRDVSEGVLHTGMAQVTQAVFRK